MTGEDMNKRKEAQGIKNNLPSGQPTIKVLTDTPTKSEMSKWNDLTIGIDIRNNFGYFKYKDSFKKFIITTI